MNFVEKNSRETKPIPVLVKNNEKEILIDENSEAPGLSIDHLSLG